MNSMKDEIVVVAHERDRLTAEQVEAIGEAAARFMDDPTRYPGLAREAAETERLIQRLRKLRRVDPEVLRRPHDR